TATRIAKCFRSYARVLRDHLAIRADSADAGAESCLELVNEGEVHASDESESLRVPDQCGERADEKRPFFLAELERGEIRRRRNHVARRVDGWRVVDPREANVRVFLRELRQVVGKDESD